MSCAGGKQRRNSLLLVYVHVVATCATSPTAHLATPTCEISHVTCQFPLHRGPRGLVPVAVPPRREGNKPSAEPAATLPRCPTPHWYCQAHSATHVGHIAVIDACPRSRAHTSIARKFEPRFDRPTENLDRVPTEPRQSPDRAPTEPDRARQTDSQGSTALGPSLALCATCGCYYGFSCHFCCQC